ncbi:MAG: Asp-tRNA(Asn)/Glu-tRNA(Gln) amidotransferase subunit GatB, partial [Planctomycetes bacterium]|nr:Asp-tRNA(Asn)/Glu-tRNA(Gln) amidotransferase subunit GatB [Planctomycetota bacterium]
MTDQTPKTRTIVGLEIHVQLRTKSKMFCGCPVKFEAPPNSCVCPVCLGHPGSLPVINRRAVEYAMLAGLALHCDIARHTKWDRKSYYYPDLPKNYQISQYDLPLCEHGHFDIAVNGETRRIRIKRAHLEEDAGKSLHDTRGFTLVDLNRTGTPLLEIVTEPDIASPDEAYIFCTELHGLLTYLGVSEGAMKKGQMRFEPNINLAIQEGGREYRTPIAEVKNLNSFRAVRSAIAYETQRQLAAWEEDHDYVLGKADNENRGWNDDKGITEYQRPKEAAHDYRYFPDPDLVPVEVSDEMLNEVRAKLPELPIARRSRFVAQYGLSAEDAETIVGQRATADRFEHVIESGGPADI